MKQMERTLNYIRGVNAVFYLVEVYWEWRMVSTGLRRFRMSSNNHQNMGLTHTETKFRLHKLKSERTLNLQLRQAMGNLSFIVLLGFCFD